MRLEARDWRELGDDFAGGGVEGEAAGELGESFDDGKQAGGIEHVEYFVFIVELITEERRRRLGDVGGAGTDAFVVGDVEPGVGADQFLELVWRELVLQLLGPFEVLFNDGVADLVTDFDGGVIFGRLDQERFQQAVVTRGRVLELKTLIGGGNRVGNPLKFWSAIVGKENEVGFSPQQLVGLIGHNFGLSEVGSRLTAGSAAEKPRAGVGSLENE